MATVRELIAMLQELENQDADIFMRTLWHDYEVHEIVEQKVRSGATEYVMIPAPDEEEE